MNSSFKTIMKYCKDINSHIQSLETTYFKIDLSSIFFRLLTKQNTKCQYLSTFG